MITQDVINEIDLLLRVISNPASGPEIANMAREKLKELLK